MIDRYFENMLLLSTADSFRALTGKNMRENNCQSTMQRDISLEKQGISVCLCVCVFLKYLCGSWSDGPESFHVATARFKGAQCCICSDCNDTVNNFFQKCFKNFASIANQSHDSHVHTRANHHRAWLQDLRNKRIYTCSSASWTAILRVVLSCSVHLNWLLWIN